MTAPNVTRAASEPELEVQALGSGDCLFLYASEVKELIAALEVRLRELRGEEDA